MFALVELRSCEPGFAMETVRRMHVVPNATRVLQHSARVSNNLRRKSNIFTCTFIGRTIIALCMLN